jgi:hypothetical protein
VKSPSLSENNFISMTKKDGLLNESMNVNKSSLNDSINENTETNEINENEDDNNNSSTLKANINDPQALMNKYKSNKSIYYSSVSTQTTLKSYQKHSKPKLI